MVNWKSKTVWGAIIGGTGFLLTSIAALINGNITLLPFIEQALIEIGAVWTIIGARHLPPFIKK